MIVQPPINARLPLIVVKRAIFDQFAAGLKTIEYRRHRPPYTIRTFYPGRWARITNNYNLARTPVLLARVIRFELAPAKDHPLVNEFYPDLLPEDELALITLDQIRPL